MRTHRVGCLPVVEDGALVGIVTAQDFLNAADSQVKIISIVEPPAPLAAEPYMGVGGYFEEAEQLMRKEAGESIEQGPHSLAPRAAFRSPRKS